MTATFAPRLFPVIHCVDPYQQNGIAHALANTKVAFDNGADGVILHGKGVDSHAFGQIYGEVRKQHPQLYIAINMPQIDPMRESRKLAALINGTFAGINALWIDSLPPIKPQIHDSIEIFAPIYQGDRSAKLTPKQQIEICRDLGYTPTSNSKDMHPQDKAEYLRYLGTIINTQPSRLANASGTTANNVMAMRLAGVTDFLVRRSISKLAGFKGEVDMLVADKVAEMARLVHSPLS